MYIVYTRIIAFVVVADGDDNLGVAVVFVKMSLK